MSSIASRLRAAHAGGLLTSALVLASSSALAGYQWAPLGTGCASAIAVGPNNVPWVLGCPSGNQWNVEQTGSPARVYYLSYVGSGLVRTPQWNYAGFSDARWLAVNLNGSPFVTDSSGQLWISVGADDNGYLYPSGSWGKWSDGGSYELGNFVASVSISLQALPDDEYFYPDSTFGAYSPSLEFTFWGVGCGSHCAGRTSYDELLFRASGSVDTTYQLSPWIQLPGAATQFALFTDPPVPGAVWTGQGTVQNPWVLNAEGSLWIWAGSNWTRSPSPGENIRYVTDHYALGVSGQVYDWTGNSAGNGGSWTRVAIDTSRTAAPIYAIASSEAAPGSFVTQPPNIGPSDLWGIDAVGNIYFLEWVGPTG